MRKNNHTRPGKHDLSASSFFGAELVLSRPLSAHSAWRAKTAGWLSRAAEFLTGAPFIQTIPNALSTNRELAHAIGEARAVQELGYPIGFTFLNRFYDSPNLYVCAGRFGKDKWDASGFDYFSQAHAFKKALYETIERLLWNEDVSFWKRQTRHASCREMRGTSLDLMKLAGFSQEQRQSDPRLAYNEETKFSWTAAESVSDGRTVWIPTQLISSAHTKGMKEIEPLLRTPNSNGLATHTSYAEATYHGLLELVERDAFMIMFANKISPPRIDPSSIEDTDVCALLEKFRKFGFSCELLLLPTDMPVAVLCAVLRDQSGVGPALAIGAKAYHDPTRAIFGAMTEAYGVWHLARTLGLYKKQLHAGPWNATERIAYWGKKENATQLAWMFEGPLISLPLSRKSLGARGLAHALEQQGCSAAAILMSPEPLKQMGIYSVCVVSAELQPLYLDSEPVYRGGARLKDVPKKLGYAMSDSPPPYPHPFP